MRRFYYSCRTGILRTGQDDLPIDTPPVERKMPFEFEIPATPADYDFCSQFTGSISPKDVSDYCLRITDIFDSWDGKRALVEFLPDVRPTDFNFAAISAL